MNDKDKSFAPHWRMARKRAEHAALRAAFDLELQLMEVNGLVVEEKPVEAEVTELPEEESPPPTSEQAIEEASESLDEILAEAEEPEDTEALWAYAKAKGIATGIVKTVLEEMGGAIEETLASLKEKYGEVE